ncbi:MAG: DUF748 domain-containing protein [Lacunisphaera sp.]
MAEINVQPAPPKTVPHRRRWPRRTMILVIVLVAILVVARLALPSALKSAVNRRLNTIPAYSGHVDDIRVSLFRGAYTMINVQLEKARSRGSPAIPGGGFDRFLPGLARTVSGPGGQRNSRAAAAAEFRPGKNQGDQPARLRPPVAGRDQRPVSDRDHALRGHQGELHFVAPDRDPPVDIFVRDLKIVVRGLRNRPDLNAHDAVATLLVEGVTPGNGQLALSSELEPLSPRPRFHLKLKIDKLSLPAVNQFLLAYGNVDVSAGEFTGYLEMVARDEHYQGYFKPFFEHLEFKNAADADRSLFARIWEKMVAGIAHLVKNNETEQVALRIPFEGDFGDTRVEKWESIKTMFRNGFIRALAEGLDGHPRPKGTPEKPATPSDPDAEKKIPEPGK